MKKEDLMEIKMMFLEALNEFANGGISTMSAAGDEGITEEGDSGTSEGEGEGEDPETDKGKGNGNTAANSGGTPAKDGRPKPNVGIGVL